MPPLINVVQDTDLCIREKYIIASAHQESLLNKRTEFISKCAIETYSSCKTLNNDI